MMTSNGATTEPDRFANEIGRNLQYVVWKTKEPIELQAGSVQAQGNAHPHVRSPERVSALGPLPEQVVHIQNVIVRSLAQVLAGMELAADQLDVLRPDIASATLVAANQILAGDGVTLLDLNITEVEI